MKTLVIIPTYNEQQNLPLITSRVRAAAPEVDILVVDDNSPDGTGEAADKLAAEDSKIHVLHRAGKGGFGGFRFDAFALHENAHLPVFAQPFAGYFGVVSEGNFEYFVGFGFVAHHLAGC